MVFVQIVVCLVAFLAQTQALIENCHVDNSICSSASPPKLGIAYSGHRLACNDIRQIVDVTSQPRITFSQGKADSFQALYCTVDANLEINKEHCDDEGDQYVLVFIDPDAPYPCAHTDGSSFVHFASVMKLVNRELKPEHILVSYHGPHPPIGTHRYQFFLFPWLSSQNPATHNSDHSRSGFKLNQFKSENNLNDPVAVFQLRVPH